MVYKTNHTHYNLWTYIYVHGIIGCSKSFFSFFSKTVSSLTFLCFSFLFLLILSQIYEHMDEGQRKTHTPKTSQQINVLVPAVSRRIQSILHWLTSTLSCISVAEFHLFSLLFHHHVLQPVSHYKSLQKRSRHLKWPSFLPTFRCRSGFGIARRLLLFHIIKFYLNIF